MNYEQKQIKKLADRLKTAGFKVFVAEKGTHGFYTDEAGKKLISFQIDFLSFTFSGNYTTDDPCSTGTGWRIYDSKPLEDSENSEDFQGMFDTIPPIWAVRQTKWKFTTVKEFLKIYQKSSKFKEVK